MADFIPKIRYRGRPALLLLLGALSGIGMSHAGVEVVWMLLPLALGLLLQLVRALYQRRSVVGTIEVLPFDNVAEAVPPLYPLLNHATLMLCTMPLFFLYAEVRDLPRMRMAEAETFYHQELQILYPLRQQMEAETYFYAKMPTPRGYSYTIRLKVPSEIDLPAEYHYGAKMIATFDLTPIGLPSKVAKRSGGQSFQNYLLSEGFEMEGVLQSIDQCAKLPRIPWLAQMRQLRTKVIGTFEEATGELITDQDKGLLYALCLGERAYLPWAVKQSFSTAGVAHLLAVSGYHLGVVFGLLSTLLLWLLPAWRHLRLRTLLLLVGLIAYTLLSGASTATLRAMLMSGILLSARILRRPTDPIQMLSLTFLIFLLINPHAYQSVGLLLSLGAVWGIYLFTTPLFTLFNPQNPLLRHLLQLLVVTIAAQLAILPLLFAYFGGVPMSFLWSNLPLILLSSLLIPVGLLALLLTPILALPDIAYILLGQLTSLLREVTQFFSPIGEDLMLTVEMDLPLLLLYYVALLLFYQLLYSRANELHGRRL